MIKAVVFASGTGSNFLNILNKNIMGIEIVMLLANKECGATTIAQNHNIPYKVIPYEKGFAKQDIEKRYVKELKEIEVDLIILAGFMKIFTPYFVKEFENKIINIHPSLLPNYRGNKAVEQALQDGKGIYGVTVHYVNELVDAGEIIDQKKIDYDGNDVDELTNLVHQVEYEIYPAAIKKVIKKFKEN